MNIIIKNKEQIDGIRASCKLAAKCLLFIKDFVKAGISTIELDRLVHEFILNNNAIPAPLNYQGFPNATCISVNEVVCHGVPSSYCLKDGDIVNIDITTILNGYYGDTSETFAVGNISSDAKKLIETARKCLKIGIDQVRPDNYFGNIGLEITKYIMCSSTYSIVESFVGHGVGVAFHEDPQVCHFNIKKDVGPLMKPGMIFTIEPMINQFSSYVRILEDNWTAATIDKGLSAQFEHSVLVTESGYEILTSL